MLGLFEGVVTDAADGYARMTGNPAATLLHLGPGMANGLANTVATTPRVNGTVCSVADAHISHTAARRDAGQPKVSENGPDAVQDR